MSGIKRFMDEKIAEQELIDAISALIDHEHLAGAALGIAKQVISDKGIDKLSEKQKIVYDSYIVPKFEISCQDEDCNSSIAFSDVPAAIRNEAYGETVYCEECQYREDAIARQMEKDD